MKLWNARTASSTQSRPFTSAPDRAVRGFRFFGSVVPAAAAWGRDGFFTLGQSGLHLAGVQDHEGLRPGVVVGHRQMHVDGVARRRQRVKPRSGAAGQHSGSVRPTAH